MDYNNIIIEGKSLAEWMKPDLDFIDYNNTTFFANVSTDNTFTVYYLGQYEYDPDVKDTTYHNGLDLARIAACSECHAPYNNMFADYPLTGDSLVRIFSTTILMLILLITSSAFLILTMAMYLSAGI